MGFENIQRFNEVGKLGEAVVAGIEIGINLVDIAADSAQACPAAVVGALFQGFVEQINQRFVDGGEVAAFIAGFRGIGGFGGGILGFAVAGAENFGVDEFIAGFAE